MEQNEVSHSQTVLFFLRVFLIVLILFTVVLVTVRVMEFNRLTEQKAQLKAEIVTEQKRIDELNYLLQAPITQEYVERIAREKFGLCYPDEKVYYHDLSGNP